MSLTEFAVRLIKERNHCKYDSPWAADNINTYRMYHIALDQNKDKRSQSLSPLQRLGNDHKFTSEYFHHIHTTCLSHVTPAFGEVY